MPALFNFLVCHKTPRPRRPRRPAAAARPFSPIVFAHSDSESDDFNSEYDTSDDSDDSAGVAGRDHYPRKAASFLIDPDTPDDNSALLEATYQAPSTSSLGDPILAPPPSPRSDDTDLPFPHFPMPRVLQPTPASPLAYRGHLGSIRAECWLFYVSQDQFQALQPGEFLSICSRSNPEPGIRYRLEQFMPTEEDSTGLVMWAQAWDRDRPLAFLIFQPLRVPPSNATLACFGLDQSCLEDATPASD